jgi:hypothetical protein
LTQLGWIVDAERETRAEAVQVVRAGRDCQRADRMAPGALAYPLQTVAWAALAYVAILALNLVSVSIDRTLLATRVSAAFASGQLRGEGLALGDWRRGINQYNDCVILQTALLSRGRSLVDAVSAQTIADPDACAALRRIARGDAVAKDSLYPYDRYVFGARSITALGLTFLSLESIREFLSALAYLLLIANFVGGLLYAYSHGSGRSSRLREASDAKRVHFNVDRLRFGITVALASAGLIALYGLHLFARNIGHVYSEIVIGGFLVAALLTGHERNHDRETALAALFGAWTAIFELLSGPVVVGLVLVGVIASSRRMPGPRPDAIQYAWTQALTFLLSCATVLLLQQIVASIATGRNAFAEFAVHLALRLQLHQVFDIQLPTLWQMPTNLAHYGPSDIASAIERALPLITYGSIEAAMAISVIALLLAIGGFALAIRSGDPQATSRVFAIASLLIVVPFWYLVFSNHTALHSLYMVRLVTTLWIGAATIAMVGWLAWSDAGRDSEVLPANSAPGS